MFGVPIFSRRDVGGGYASVEFGSEGSCQAVALQFAAGAWPERAAGLNRFGVFKEVTMEDGSNSASTFAGIISANTSKDTNLEDAHRSLKSTSPISEVTVTHGRSQQGRAWNLTRTLPTAAPQTWMEAETLLHRLLRESAPETPANGGSPAFLTVIRKAALCIDPSYKSAFLHAGKLYTLETRWAKDSSGEMIGQIRNAAGVKSAEFRAFYLKDSSGIPMRIEYRPKSFLKLTFEADTTTSHPQIPSLFPEVNA